MIIKSRDFVIIFKLFKKLELHKILFNIINGDFLFFQKLINLKRKQTCKSLVSIFTAMEPLDSFSFCSSGLVKAYCH